ncbi:MAG: hypothetical protein K2O59_10425 [Lachnospiraceae bacterium]|nr:hypothetical protein [Lachnospiraceae bacterium]
MKDKKSYIITIIIGVVLVGVGLLTKFDYYSTLIFAMGFGMISSSMVHLLRTIYWQNPKRHSEYEAKMREAHIDKVDERKQYLRMKAGYITYQIMAFVLLSISFILALLRVSTWATGITFLLFILHWVVGIVVYRDLERKL